MIQEINLGVPQSKGLLLWFTGEITDCIADKLSLFFLIISSPCNF